ncbi:MAG: acyl-CoA dehydrogenase family protein, partial [Hyphococcus sp.]
LLKVQATRTMERCAREAAQILGGASYMRGCRIERIYREVRVMAIGGGSEEIMNDLAMRQTGL